MNKYKEILNYSRKLNTEKNYLKKKNIYSVNNGGQEKGGEFVDELYKLVVN